MSGQGTKAKPPRQARKLRPVVGGPWSLRETMSILAYISDPCQPDEKYGGFHPNTVICAASAITHLRELRACLREAIEITHGVVYDGTRARWKSAVRGSANDTGQRSAAQGATHAKA